MERPLLRRSYIGWVAAALILAGPPAFADPPERSIAVPLSEAVKAGDVISVTRWSGPKVKGGVVSTSACSIVVRPDGRPVAIPITAIKTIRRYATAKRDPGARAALDAAERCQQIGCAPLTVAYVAVAAVGRRLEALGRRGEVVYRGTRSDSVAEQCTVAEEAVRQAASLICYHKFRHASDRSLVREFAVAVPRIDRRTALKLLVLAGASAPGAMRLSAGVLVPAMAALDHLLLGVSDLDRGIAWVAERTGVRPAIGGSHPGRGTRNALLSLGPKQYLEIIAPDPAQSTFTFQIDIRSLKEPRLITWAAATSDIDAVAQRARAAGRQVFGPTDGSRARPDGATLRWRSLGVASTIARGAVDPVPFFIQWAGDSVHPAQDSPKGGELTAFRLIHPDAPALIETLEAVGIEAEVTSGPEAVLAATLVTAKGKLELR